MFLIRWIQSWRYQRMMEKIAEEDYQQWVAYKEFFVKQAQLREKEEAEKESQQSTSIYSLPKLQAI